MEFKKGIYKHYKGNYYELIGVGKHSETLEEVVIYKALYGEHGLWARPASMWNEMVEVDGKFVPRFQFIEDGRPLNGVFREEDLELLFPSRKRNSHKGDYGYVAIIGGSLEYSGAVRLAALAHAALRSGAGVATVAVPRSIAPIVANQVLDATVFPLNDRNGEFVYNQGQFLQLIDRYDVIAFGMGMGNTPETREALKYLLKYFRGTLIVDADGINAMAELDRMSILTSRPNLVLTPHVKEFSRLSGKSIIDIEMNPIPVVEELAIKLDAVIVLKGADSYITDGHAIYVNSTGSPGMATGGSGDVLSGIMAATCAVRPDDLLIAAAGACYINGKAGELAAEEIGETSMLASDTAAHIRYVLKKGKDIE